MIENCTWIKNINQADRGSRMNKNSPYGEQFHFAFMSAAFKYLVNLVPRAIVDVYKIDILWAPTNTFFFDVPIKLLTFQVHL